jgi:hypothetical protein
MSPELAQFYSELQQFIDEGKTSKDKFKTDCGICGNLYYFCKYHKIPFSNEAELYIELITSFKEAKLNFRYPFNNGSLNAYVRDDCLNNPLRLAWIKDHANTCSQQTP